MPERKRGKGGRPTDLTQELQDKLCNLLRAGNYVEPAAASLGIRKSTLYKWLRRGGVEWKHQHKGGKPNKRELIYLSFVDAVEKAQGQAEARDVALTAKAAESQWQAAAWRLERKFPERWGRKVQAEIVSESSKGKRGGSPLRIKLVKDKA